MRRLIELLKSILIVLLICSLVLLTVAAVPTHTLREIPWLASLLQPIAPLLGLPQAELAYVAPSPAIVDAARPVAISVRNSAGRSTAQWDFNTLDARFDSLGSFLGQALDTSEIFTKVSDTQLQTALSGSSAYFSYGEALPPALLASWLGGSLEAAVPDAESCLLALNGSQVQLYLIGETSYAADTPLSAEELSALLESFRPDGSRFAFETDYRLSPLSLIPGDVIVLPGGTVSTPLSSRYVEQLATDLGFNPYAENRYTDSEGAVHFSEANCALAVEATGTITLTSAAEGRFAAAGPDLPALVEAARQLADLATGDTLGDGRLYLSGVRRTDSETVCTFDYLFSGLPVILDGGSAASVTFSGLSVTQMTVRPRGFAANDATLYPLPVAQAAALLADGSRLELQYRVTADGILDAGWKN